MLAATRVRVGHLVHLETMSRQPDLALLRFLLRPVQFLVLLVPVRPVVTQKTAQAVLRQFVLAWQRSILS